MMIRLLAVAGKIELVDANHNVFSGQVATLTFTVPEYDRAKVYSRPVR